MNERVLTGILVAVFLAAIAYFARRELRFVRTLMAFMANRGFVRDANPTIRLEPAKPRLDSRFAWRGALSTGESLRVFVGRGYGEKISPTAKLTSTGQRFYIWVLLPANGTRDDAWLARFRGDARATRQNDGSTLVYWQRDYSADNVAAALRELEQAMQG